MEARIKELENNKPSHTKQPVITDEHIVKVAKAAIDENHVTKLYRNT